MGGPLSNRQLVPSEASKVAGATDSTDSLRVIESKPDPFWAGRDRGSREVQVRALGAGKIFKSSDTKMQAGRIKVLLKQAT